MLGQAFLSSLDTAGRRWRDGMRILHAGKVTEFSAAIESGQCTVAADVHGTYDARFHSQVPTYKTSLALAREMVFFQGRYLTNLSCIPEYTLVWHKQTT